MQTNTLKQMRVAVTDFIYDIKFEYKLYSHYV